MVAIRRDLCGIYPQVTQKISREALTRVGFIEYQSTLYGDAARGCHHRGDGPGTRKASISTNRQRLGVLIDEGFAAKPDGTIGSRSLGAAGKHDGSEEEGREEAGQQGSAADLSEEVGHFSSVV